MGYQDGMGLRPGRTKDKVSADRGSTDSTFSASAGYRAAGAITPQRLTESSDALKANRGNSVAARADAPGQSNDRSALAQFNADSVRQNIPKAPGLMETVGTSVATKAAGSALERGADRLLDRGVAALFNGGNDLRLADVAKDAGGYINLTTGAETFPVIDYGAGIQSLGEAAGSVSSLADPGYIDTLGDWGGAADAASSFADPGYIDVLGDWGGAGADAASSGIPVLGPALKLAQGDVGGAAGSVIGGLIGGPIGAIAGGFLGGGCFITEATMAGLGVQDDNAEPLMVLRFFRDKVLAGTPQGQAMIQEYEAIAPLVVQAVQSRPDAMEIFKKIYTDFIAPAVEAIKAQNFPGALQIYAAMIAAVTPLAQEAMDAEDAMEGEMQQASEPQEGAQEAMQQMGAHAGMVAQDPRVAQQAAPQGVALQQFNADDDYPSSVRFGRR